MDRISVNGKALVDEFGRERIFNGINMVNKDGHAKGIPDDWTEDFVAALKTKGINLIRLGMTWAGVEPNPNEYNEEYLNSYSDFMDMCSKYGIYCFLDMHQDLYGSCDCSYGGDGAPKWAYLSNGKLPRKAKFVWAEGYFFPGACHTAFDNFWNNARYNGKGLQDYFFDMWAHVADKFKDKPNLLGFDIFNEPFPGSAGGRAFFSLVKGVASTVLTHKNVDRKKLLKDLMKAETRNDLINVLNDKDVYSEIIKKASKIVHDFDCEYYYPFLKRTAAAIRNVTDKGLILMENCYYSNLGIPCTTPRLVYNDGTVENGLVFAPHGYDLMVDTPAYSNASNERVDHIFNEHARTQERLDVPVIVGEWGGFYNDESGDCSYSHLIHLLQFFDSHKWSNTYWCFWQGIENSKIMEIIARPYPIAVPGEITSYKFDYESKKFVLNFTVDKKVKQAAEVFIPKEPVSVETEGKYEICEDSGMKYLKVKPVSGENTVTVTF